MARRPQRHINTELEELERELAALTLRVAEIRNRANADSTSTVRVPNIGDRVRFRINGKGNVEGVIIGITTHRLRIRQDSTSYIILRAPHNVTLI